ncbi:MAG: Pycsar system effector family protein [Arcticibacter sp.]
MEYKNVLDHVERYVERMFSEKESSNLIYHNLSHTEYVAKHTKAIAIHYNLTEDDLFIVQAAAWFHDVGYLSGQENHESKSASLAAEFLRSHQVPSHIIDAVQGCILSTRMPQQPQTLLQQIVCDADLYHLGSDNFQDRSKLMRQEAQLVAGKKIKKEKWRAKTIELLTQHQFHTDYCRSILEEKKQQNLLSLRNEAISNAESTLSAVAKELQTQTAPAKDKELKRKDRPERGIETMFRISSNNHQRLSDMADNKAHIMISTNSIILSVVLSILLRKLENNTHLIIPTMMLLTVCLITIVFSILATRPSVPSGSFSNEDIEKKQVNLLFFGNFYRMSLQDYQKGMHAMMDDRDFLYGSLIRDLYSQGVVLGRKYKLMRAAYSVFMFGIVASVVAFVIAVILVTD